MAGDDGVIIASPRQKRCGNRQPDGQARAVAKAHDAADAADFERDGETFDPRTGMGGLEICRRSRPKLRPQQKAGTAAFRARAPGDLTPRNIRHDPEKWVPVLGEAHASTIR